MPRIHGEAKYMNRHLIGEHLQKGIELATDKTYQGEAQGSTFRDVQALSY